MSGSRKEEEVFARFLLESKALIVDTASSARTRIVGALCQMGAKRHNILATGSFQEAQETIPNLKPQLVLCDFNIGTRSGLDLLQEQRGAHEDLKKCLFVLVTGNTSQSAVARAAEEDVDTYILKPYTQESFKRSLVVAVNNKINPSDYLRTVEEGKALLFLSQPDAAMPIFEKAMKMTPEPTLACFYMGQAELMKEAMDQAGGSFEKGLSFSRIHYKCLVGLFEVLSKQKRHTESYDVIKRIAQYFPANPTRLGSVLRLAIMTQNFEDIEGFYRIFTQIDERPDALVNYMCSALVVTAKHYLITHNKRRALELFDKAIVTSAGRTRFIRYSIEALLDAKLPADGEALLKRFPGESREAEDYLVSDLMVMSQIGTSSAGKILQRGRDLLKRGLSAPAIYKVLIEHAAKSGLNDAAEDLTSIAGGKWANQADEFKQILDKNKHPPENSL